MSVPRNCNLQSERSVFKVAALLTSEKKHTTYFFPRLNSIVINKIRRHQRDNLT